MEETVAYSMATVEDVAALVTMRAAFLAEVEDRPTRPELLAALSGYFSRAVASGEFIACIAIASGHAIATSGMVFRRHPPSSGNLQGLEAYVMNMYTLPAWRERGIATALLRQLIRLARQTNCSRISLHATPKAVPVYARLDFKSADAEMRLALQ